MDKQTKQVSALFALFEQVLYGIPQERRPLAFALFKASLAVSLHGVDQVGGAFAKRAIEWNTKRGGKAQQAADDMQVFQAVMRLRRDAVDQGAEPPPLTRLPKKNRRTAFELIGEKDGSSPSTVEGAHLRHQRLRKPKTKKS